jgi:V8-like Glu-specific endopeptidase
MNSKRLLVLTAVALLSLSLVAQERVEPLFLRDAVGVKAYAAAPRLAQRAGVAPAIELPAAAATVPEEIERIRLWNQGHNEPARNGFFRVLPDTISVRLDGAAVAAGKGESASFARGVVAATSTGTIVYSTSIRVEGADRLRLRLDHVSLPEGATLWIYGSNETPTGFGRELLNDGTLWTPPALGPLVYLDVEIPSPKTPAGAASFDIHEVLEMLHSSQLALTPKPDDSPTCLVDAVCVQPSKFDDIRSAQKGVAHIEFVTSQGGAVCTGGLLNDRNSTGTLNFLTANHCISTQGVASTVTSYFDFTSISCNGSFNGNSAPHTSGATLQATGTISDFTLLKLNSIPSGRVLLGWDPRSSKITSGVRLHRISHPVPADTIFPQMYSNTLVNTSFGTCQARPRSSYLYSTGGEGGVYGGSSGSPVMLDGGYVVGQLLGSCGPSPSDGCNQANATVDGAFFVTYNQIQSFLENGSGGTPSPCTPSATVACLVGGRFSVKVDWQTSDGKTGTGTAIKYTDATGLFWFFGSDNIEMLVKILNACPIGSTYWVFSAATTDVQYVLTVTDSKTGLIKTYTHPQGTPAPAITDTNAFDKNAACP